MSVFVSNGFYRKEPVLKSIERFSLNGITDIEISCGRVEKSDLKELINLKKTGINFRLHNYFPSFSNDFVLNLASTNSEIRNFSRTLIEDALIWSSELESNYYAFHAGFLLDLVPSDLGGNLQKKTLVKREHATKIFQEELFKLKSYANRLGVQLAIENNVYDHKNFQKYGLNIPLLLVCEDDLSDILVDGVGILLDFGHLKVSSNILSLDLDNTLESWKKHITGYHLSDNNGISDQNFGFSNNCWFFSKDINYNLPITIEVYDISLERIKSLKEIVERRAKYNGL